jgi:superfamily I DNA and/or RNA helicase
MARASHVPSRREAIVAELKRLMDSTEGRELTFGVISFYKQQVKAIEDALVKTRHRRSNDDATEIVDPTASYSFPTVASTERLRFGTVDAFQGMEFDVVFLSMVRSNPARDLRARHLTEPALCGDEPPEAAP